MNMSIAHAEESAWLKFVKLVMKAHKCLNVGGINPTLKSAQLSTSGDDVTNMYDAKSMLNVLEVLARRVTSFLNERKNKPAEYRESIPFLLNQLRNFVGNFAQDSLPQVDTLDFIIHAKPSELPRIIKTTVHDIFHHGLSIDPGISNQLEEIKGKAWYQLSVDEVSFSGMSFHYYLFIKVICYLLLLLPHYYLMIISGFSFMFLVTEIVSRQVPECSVKAWSPTLVCQATSGTFVNACWTTKEIPYNVYFGYISLSPGF